MVIVVADSSVLILLCKIELLEVVCTKHEVIIPDEVYKEAIEEGLTKNHPDASKLKELTDNKKIRLQKITKMEKFKEINEIHGLGKGEAEAICLFSEGKASIVATDDFKAIKYCERFRIPFTTTIRLIFDCVNEKEIDKSTAIKMVRELSFKGRYNNQIIFDALEKLEGGKNG
ncbi:hypothetical protein HYY72_00665 [Candidatus Woesearchaeota archaeon]|nr:hypothetical protein [Candidatus Woesearchaeota archaeon]